MPRASTITFHHEQAPEGCPLHHPQHGPSIGTHVVIDGDRLTSNDTVHKISDLAQRTLTLTESSVVVGGITDKPQLAQQRQGTRLFHYVGVVVVVLYLLRAVFGVTTINVIA